MLSRYRYVLYQMYNNFSNDFLIYFIGKAWISVVLCKEPQYHEGLKVTIL